MKIEVDKRGLVFKRGLTSGRGEYVRLLKPGRHTIPPWQQVEIYDIF